MTIWLLPIAAPSPARKTAKVTAPGTLLEVDDDAFVVDRGQKKCSGNVKSIRDNPVDLDAQYPCGVVVHA